MECDYLIVDAGFFGSVIAERISNDLNSEVVIIDKRAHIGADIPSAQNKGAKRCRGR